MFKLPERSTLVHKAIDIGKLSKANAPVLGVSGLPDTNLYHYTRKYDGCSVIVIVDYDLNVHFYSRDGKEVTSLSHMTGWLQRLPAGTVLLGEAWRRNAEFREISGEFRRKAPQEQLDLVVFDSLMLCDFIAGVSTTPYEFRRIITTKMVIRCGHVRVYEASHCYPWEIPSLVDDPTAAYDGAVAKLNTGIWTAGAGRGGEVLKVKNVIDVDLLCIGIEEGQKRLAGTLGAIVCRYKDGIELRVGTGFNDELRRTCYDDPDHIVGKVVRIMGMKDSGKGSLREPRFKGIRYDKDTPDY